MRRYCDKLANEQEWKDLPVRYRANREVYDNYGRCAIVFFDEDDLGPEIALGFYYAKENHRIPFVDPRQKGIDLHLRVYASPAKNPSPTRVLKLLSARVPALQKLGATVHLKGHPGSGNKWNLLMVQKSLLDVIDGIQDDEKQIAAMHAELILWCKAVFADPKLLKAFKTIKR